MQINPSSKTVTYALEALKHVEMGLNDIEHDALNNDSIDSDSARSICMSLNQVRDNLGLKRGFQRHQKWAKEQQKAT